jgi:succinyl-CoA synthetase alpha subunit
MSILIDENTTAIVQGITGREGRIITKDSLEYGAKIVAGVTPGKGGERVAGIPVYDCVQQVLASHIVDATIVSVPPLNVRDAAIEAIEANIKLILIFAERVPRKDVAYILSLAAEYGVTVVGPNSLGIIVPDKSKLGSIGGDYANTTRTFKRGAVGIVSRSGGMTAEIASLLTSHGIGQSTCVSIGGDPMVGVDFKDLYRMFENDDETRAVVLFCEPGGTMEEELVDYVQLTKIKKPLIAFVAGRFVDNMPGVRFGHAGVIVEKGRGSAQRKIELFMGAGINVADKLRDLIPMLEQAQSTN